MIKDDDCNCTRDSLNQSKQRKQSRVDYFRGFLLLFTGYLARSKFSWREVADNGGLAIFVPCPGHGRTDGQTDNENEECPAEPDMKTSLRNGNGYDGVRFDLTVPCYLEPAAFSSESSESATNLADRRTSLHPRFLSRKFLSRSMQSSRPDPTCSTATLLPTNLSINFVEILALKTIIFLFESVDEERRTSFFSFFSHF